MTREPRANPDAVDAVLAGSWCTLAVAMKSLDMTAGETTVAQYRALTVLASRGPERLVDLAGALGVAPSSAGRMCDRLARKGLIRKHRARSDRRAVLISVTPTGLQVAGATAQHHRALIADILGGLPVPTQRTIAAGFREFADAAGRVPDRLRQSPVPEGPVSVPRPRPSVRRSVPGYPAPSARTRTGSGHGG